MATSPPAASSSPVPSLERVPCPNPQCSKLLCRSALAPGSIVEIKCQCNGIATISASGDGNTISWQPPKYQRFQRSRWG